MLRAIRFFNRYNVQQTFFKQFDPNEVNWFHSRASHNETLTCDTPDTAMLYLT